MEFITSAEKIIHNHGLKHIWAKQIFRLQMYFAVFTVFNSVNLALSIVLSILITRPFLRYPEDVGASRRKLVGFKIYDVIHCGVGYL